MVVVLLSTYNGAPYLEDQLDSILSQDYRDFHILIRDDGSSDNTIEILRNYKDSHQDKITLVEGKNMGSKSSFFTLANIALEKFPDSEYYAFADQDDVWLPEKISKAMEILDTDTNPHRLYYCDPVLVDSKLRKIRDYHLDTRNTLEESFIIQPALGCTIVVSFPLLKKIAACSPGKFAMHDACAYMLALALGGFVYHDSDALIYYRQHSSNAIGYNQSFFHKWRRRFMEFKNSPKIRTAQAEEILELFGDSLPAEQRNTLQLIVSQKDSIKAKTGILLSGRFTSRKRVNNMLFRVAVLCNKL